MSERGKQALNDVRQEDNVSEIRVGRKAAEAALQHARFLIDNNLGNITQQSDGDWTDTGHLHEYSGDSEDGYPKSPIYDEFKSECTDVTARGQTDENDAVHSWATSTIGHRDSITEDRECFGLGSARGSDGDLFWIMLLCNGNACAD